MNRTISGFVFKIAVFSTLLYLQGCASQSWKVTDADIKTELVSSDYLKISKVMIFEKSNGFLITAYMLKKNLPALMVKGHIDIDIVDSKGRVLHKTTTRFHRVGKANRPRVLYKFSIEVPYIPSEGGIVRVEHHKTALHQEAFHSEG